MYGWVMSQMLPVNNFEWINDTYQFDKDFIKNYNEESDEGYFLKLMFNTQKNYMNVSDSPFLPHREKLKKSKSL